MLAAVPGDVQNPEPDLGLRDPAPVSRPAHTGSQYNRAPTSPDRGPSVVFWDQSSAS